MAAILQHKKTKEKYILLGAGYGRSHGDYKTVEQTYLCVAKEDGSIWWVKDEDVELYKIDGESPEKALRA